jgi:hypothetical protein
MEDAVKRIIAGIVLLDLFAVPLTGCSEYGSPTSVPALPPENVGDTSSSVVQSGLPLKVTVCYGITGSGTIPY